MEGVVISSKVNNKMSWLFRFDGDIVYIIANKLNNKSIS